MGSTAQPLANLFGKASNIGALGTTHLELKQGRCIRQQRELVQGNGAGLPLNGLATSRHLIERTAVVLKRGIHGGHLFLLPKQAWSTASSSA